MSQVLATRDSGRPHGRSPHAGGVCSTLSTIPPRWASSAPLQTGPTSGETHMLSRQFAAYDRRARPDTLTRSWALLHATPHGLSCKRTQQLQLPMFSFVLFLGVSKQTHGEDKRIALGTTLKQLQFQLSACRETGPSWRSLRAASRLVRMAPELNSTVSSTAQVIVQWAGIGHSTTVATLESRTTDIGRQTQVGQTAVSIIRRRSSFRTPQVIHWPCAQ